MEILETPATEQQVTNLYMYDNKLIEMAVALTFTLNVHCHIGELSVDNGLHI